MNAASTAHHPDGHGWESAFRDLQDALAHGGVEIWVAAGAYAPGSARNATFKLHRGQALHGGFSGRETRREARDPAAHRTVLDGDGDYHVVTGADGAILDGFTITGGRADGEGYDCKGGGLINYRDARHGAPFSKVAAGNSTIARRCVFTGNASGGHGGGALAATDSFRIGLKACGFVGDTAGRQGDNTYADDTSDLSTMSSDTSETSSSA